MYADTWDTGSTIGIGLRLSGNSSSISVFLSDHEASPRIVFNDLSGIEDGVFPAISLAGKPT